MSQKWTQQDIPDLTGWVAFVTGATDGRRAQLVCRCRTRRAAE